MEPKVKSRSSSSERNPVNISNELDTDPCLSHVYSPGHYSKRPDTLLKAVRGALVEGKEPTSEYIETFVKIINSLGSVEEIRGGLRWNSWKYRDRYLEKNGVEDLLKAAWYENKLLILEQKVAEYHSNKLKNK